MIQRGQIEIVKATKEARLLKLKKPLTKDKFQAIKNPA
jgi:hypothetical protein